MIGSLVDYDEFSSESEDESHTSEQVSTSKAANSKEKVPSDQIMPTTMPSGKQENSGIVNTNFKIEEDEVEVDLRMRLPGNLKKSDILKPPPRRRKKGKITITAFQLSDGSDSDEADTKKTAPRVNKKGPHQGLASLLPAPQAMIVREGNKPLIPHAVSRRTAAPKAAPKADAPQPAPEVEEPSKMKSFFALDDDEDEDEAMPISNLAPRPLDSEPVGPKRSNEVGTPMEAGPALPEPMASDDNFIPEDILPESERRLQRKRRHDGSSGIIDIRQEQLTAGSEIEFTKTISQEEDEFAKKRLSESMPSKMAARKHQITWLAYRAKEQEFELKNSWATAKHNKMQTRNKYGF